MFDRSFGLGKVGTLSGPTTPPGLPLPLGTNMLVVARAARALPLLAALSRPQSFLRSGFAPFACAAAATSSSSVSDLLAAWLDKALTAEARKRKALQKEADAARSAERLGQWATLVVANLYRIDPAAERAIVEDWENGGTPTELKFDPSEGTPREQADKAFAKARKLRLGRRRRAHRAERGHRAQAARLAAATRRLGGRGGRCE
jgi:NFACT N-terminal and middle domains